MHYEPTWESLRHHGIPKWYEDAKFGIFIHWGLYSVPAWATPIGELGDFSAEEWFKNNPYAEWYQNSLRIKGSPTWKHHVETYGENFEYERFAELWKAERWNPDEWAELFKKAGAKYVVPTTKHHEGFCLWPSKYTDFRVILKGPKRDIIGELSKSVRNAGLRFGVYYSGALDWRFTKEPIAKDGDIKYIRPHTYEYSDYAYNQFMELIELYLPDILWNDIGWPEKGREDLKYLFAYFYNRNPNGLVNDRWDVNHWDFRTAEYHLGYHEDIPSYKWEFCRGLGYSFGYNQVESEEHTLTVEQLISVLSDVVSKGGNLLLNVGPKADGTIPEIQKERLIGLGKWLEKNGEAIYETRPWSKWGEKIDEKTEIRYTKRDNNLYVIVLGRLQKDDLKVSNVQPSENTKVELLEINEPLKYSYNGKDLIISIPQNFKDKYGIVIKISPIPKTYD